MSVHKFDDYLQEKLKNPDFKAGFEAEKVKLDRSVALMKAKDSYSYKAAKPDQSQINKN